MGERVPSDRVPATSNLRDVAEVKLVEVHNDVTALNFELDSGWVLIGFSARIVPSDDGSYSSIAQFWLGFPKPPGKTHVY